MSFIAASVKKIEVRESNSPRRFIFWRYKSFYVSFEQKTVFDENHLYNNLEIIRHLYNIKVTVLYFAR